MRTWAARLAGSLRARLVALVLLAVVPALGLTAFEGVEYHERAGIAARDDALRVTRLAQGRIERAIDETHALLLVLAEVPAVRDLDPEACNKLMANLVARRALTGSLIVTDASGDAVCSGLPLPGPVSFADRAWFQQVLTARDFVVADYVIGQVSQGAQLNTAYPLIGDDGRIHNVIGAGIDLAALTALAAEAQLPEGSVLTVVDDAGTILLRQPDPEAWVGQTFPDVPLVEAVIEQGEGSIETVGIDGVQRLYGFTPLAGGTVSDPVAAGSAAFVAVGIPSSVAYAAAHADFERNVIGLLLAGWLALTAAWFGGGYFLVHPMRGLIATTQRLAAGDLTARTGLGHRAGEIGQLAAAFDDMATTLKETLERREAAEAERTLVAVAVEQSADAVLITDSSGTITYVNAALERLSGYSRDELLGSNPRLFKSGRHDAAFYRAMWATLTAGRTWTAVMVNRRKDGTPYEAASVISPVHDAAGAPIGYFQLVRDVTREKELEAQLRQAQKMEAIGQLAGGIAHDFNNLLTAISGFSQLLLGSLAADDPRRADVAEIDKPRGVPRR